MRHVYAALLLSSLAVPVRAQWTHQSPSPTHLGVEGVAALTPDRVFLATDDDVFDDGGAMFESQNGGQTWTQRFNEADLRGVLHGVVFRDALNGWAFGNVQARTTDGGTTWAALPLLGTVYDMAFHTPTFGHANAGGGFTFVSHDAGDTWVESPDTLSVYRFADDQVGLGLSSGRAVNRGVFRTADGGATFAMVQSGTATDAAWLTGSLALALVDSTVRRSTDGGLTWTDLGARVDNLNRLTAASETVALAWVERAFAFGPSGGGMWRSADGGQTWTNLGVVISEGIAEIAVLDAQTLVARGPRGGAYRSADGGQTWAQTFASPGPLPGGFGPSHLDFADAQTGYLAYGPGFVVKTTDGGQTWTQVSSGTGESLNDVVRFDDGAMLAVGDGGAVLTNATGTAAWIQREGPTALDLVALDPLGLGEAVAADAEGRVYHTTDGGATWAASASAPANFQARDLRFTSAQEGWVVGSGFSQSAIFRTTDGGTTWTPVPGIRGAYAAVDAEGEHVWATNVGDLIAYSHDGGDTWQTLDPGDVFGATDLAFWDESTGYLVGTNGYAARSDDGGLTWSELPLPFPDDDFTGLYLLGPNELWISTRNDRAYYSATGGQNWAVLDVGTTGSSLFGSFEAIAASPEGSAWMVGSFGAIEYFEGPPPPPLNRPPVASFTFETTRLTVDFTDASSDPDGTVVSHAWDFGDGAISAEPSPSHTFTEAGTFIVRLTVTDDDGATGQTGRVIVVQEGPGGTFGGFTEVTPFESPFVTPQDEDYWIASAASADVDLDGDLDVVTFGYYVVYHQSVDERLILFRNDGPGAADEWTYTQVDLPLAPGLTSGLTDLAFGDYDGDGDPDLVIGSDGQTVLYRNDAGSLAPTDIALPPYYEDNDQADFDLRSITWADTDNDGDLDLFLPSVADFDAFTYRTALMRNDGPDGAGGWMFTETDSTFAPTGHAQSAWADDDGDGDLDLLLIHIAPLTDEGFIRRYRNDGGNVFVGEDLLDGLTVEHGEAQWGDADGDGDLDILIAGHVGEPTGGFPQAVRLYRNDGAGTYTREDILNCAVFFCEGGWLDITAATWADSDSDGDIDILLTGSYNSGSQIDGRAAVLLNDGTGSFVVAEGDLPAPRAGGTRGGTFSWMDLENDGDLDYVVAGDYFQPGGNGLIEAQLHIYRNDAAVANLAPSVPTGLSASVGATGEAMLTWNPATDDTTPADALTYDLTIRRDGAPVATPRRLPEPGALGASTQWTLAGLSPGTYTWSVRAVDAAFTGSAVAEGTFTVGATANEGDTPLVLALEAPAPNPARARARLAFTLPDAGEATLEVFDALGRRVVTLAEGPRPAGRHEVEWAANDLPAGTYVVRLRAGDRTLVQRATVIR